LRGVSILGSFGRYLKSNLIRIVAASALMILAAVLATAPYRDGGGSEPDGETHASAARQKPKISFWQRTADDPVAIFTAVLATFTMILAGVSIVQIYFLTKADKTARISADAAKQSADVAERSLEQAFAPYVDVKVTPKAAIQRLVGGAIVADFMHDIFAEYTLSNYGQSPAIILEIYQYCVRMLGIPDEIPFPPLQTNLYQTLVVGGMKESGPLPIPFPNGGISDLGPDTIWVGLQIRYRDVFRNQYLSTYCGTFNPHRAAFTAYGAPRYNDRRKLTGDELKIAESRDSS
jgi:hypothetical protein